MKPKLSPQEYRDILKLIELKSINLKEISSKFPDEPPKEVTLKIKEKGSFSQDHSILKVSYGFKLIGKENNKDESSFSISSEFILVFSVSGEKEISVEFFDIFKDYLVSMTAWPYFREIVSSLISKANLPPLFLPMRKI